MAKSKKQKSNFAGVMTIADKKETVSAIKANTPNPNNLDGRHTKMPDGKQGGSTAGGTAPAPLSVSWCANHIDDAQGFSMMQRQSPARHSSLVRLRSFAFLPMAFLFGVGQKFAALGENLLAYGALGLFAITLLDSAFIPIPGGPDAAMVILSAANPGRMFAYAMVATIGSTIGCTILYLIARRAGMAALSRVNPERRDRIENLLGRYDMLAVMLPAVLPPPFPFKPFVLSAGVFKLKLPRFVLAIFIGRAIRFLIEGWLAIRFGTEALPLIKQHGLKVLIAVGVLLLVFIAASYFKRKRQPQSLAVDESTAPN